MKNMDFNEVVQPGHEVLDFVQCQRSDGTIYGSRGGCKQKGSKEVSKSEGGVGLFGATGKDNAKKASKGELKIKALGSQATIDLISEAVKGDASTKAKKEIVETAYKHLTDLAKGEGKKPPTITSIVSGSTLLKKVGLDPDTLNAKYQSASKSKAKTAAKPAKPKGTDWTSTLKGYDSSKKTGPVTDFEGFTNYFKQQGLKNPEARGALATLNVHLNQKGGLSSKDAQANAALLSKKDLNVKTAAKQMKGFSTMTPERAKAIMKGGKPKAADKKTAAEAREGSKTKASLTRNASKKEVLDEYRNNLANGQWTTKQQNYSPSVKASAQRDAINQLVREGFDPRKLLSVPGFDKLADNVNRFRYK